MLFSVTDKVIQSLKNKPLQILQKYLRCPILAWCQLFLCLVVYESLFFSILRMWNSLIVSCLMYEISISLLGFSELFEIGLKGWLLRRALENCSPILLIKQGNVSPLRYKQETTSTIFIVRLQLQPPASLKALVPSIAFTFQRTRESPF